MVIFPNAKLNLGLRILERLPSGYHALETIFLPIGLCDVIEIVPLSPSQTADEWLQNGIPIEGKKEENTVLRTLQLLREEGYALPPVSIELLKKIPFGAGLGGGSSDASFTLKALNDMFHLGLSTETMLSLIKRIGADCPFFIYNTPMLGEGIGERLTPLTLPKSIQKATVLLIKPPIFISTKEAYSAIKCHPEARNSLTTLLEKPLSEWSKLFINDFEEPLFAQHPRLKEIKEYLYALGADYASMSGSGSTLYGIFTQSIPSLDTALLSDCFVWQGTWQ